MKPTEKSSSSRKLEANFTEENINLLIETVESHGLLWNAATPDYKSRTKRDATWQELADDVFKGEFSVNDIQLKWQSLRTQFKTCYAKSRESKSGQGAKKPVSWKYFGKMSFIQAAEEVQTSNSESNLDFGTPEESIVSDNIDEDTVEMPLQKASSTGKKRRISDKDDNNMTMKKMAIEGMQKAMKNLESETSFHRFGSYLASELVKIKDEHGQTQANLAQRKLTQCLLNFQDELERLAAPVNYFIVTQPSTIQNVQAETVPSYTQSPINISTEGDSLSHVVNYEQM